MRAAAVRIAVAIPLVLAAATLFTAGHTVWAWSLVWVALILLTVGYVHATTSLSEHGTETALPVAGRCGAALATQWGASLCCLAVDHRGWHRSDTGTEWGISTEVGPDG